MNEIKESDKNINKNDLLLKRQRKWQSSLKTIDHYKRNKKIHAMNKITKNENIIHFHIFYS